MTTNYENEAIRLIKLRSGGVPPQGENTGSVTYVREQYTRVMGANTASRLSDPVWFSQNGSTAIATTGIKTLRFGVRGTTGLLKYRFGSATSSITEPSSVRPCGYFEELTDGIGDMAFSVDTSGVVLEIQVLREVT